MPEDAPRTAFLTPMECAEKLNLDFIGVNACYLLALGKIDYPNLCQQRRQLSDFYTVGCQRLEGSGYEKPLSRCFSSLESRRFDRGLNALTAAKCVSTFYAEELWDDDHRRAERLGSARAISRCKMPPIIPTDFK